MNLRTLYTPMHRWILSALLFTNCSPMNYAPITRDGGSVFDASDRDQFTLSDTTQEQSNSETSLSDGSSFCQGSGSPFVLTTDAGTTDGRCTGSLAATTFRFALCTCEGLVTSFDLATDAFDSASGSSIAGVAGAVGTNGMLNSSGTRLQIGGSLWVSHPSGLVLNPQSNVGGELRSGGPLGGSGSLHVGLNAFVNGNVTITDISVAGTLSLPEGATITDRSPLLGMLRRAPVRVDPPCDCDPSRRPALRSFLQQYQNNNDNASLSLRPDAFANVQGNSTLELPCGRYFLSSIQGDGGLSVRIRGRVALFVNGDISVQQALSFTLDPGAELDVFVGGTINASNRLDFGSRSTPARVRVYVAGNGTINLAGGAVFAGNLYAPDAEVVASGPLEVFGSILARRLSASGAVRIHYDAAVLREGERCTPNSTPDAGIPARSCDSCRACDNQACINGRCANCTDDSQCCAPLVCWNGRCLPVPG